MNRCTISILLTAWHDVESDAYMAYTAGDDDAMQNSLVGIHILRHVLEYIVETEKVAA